MQHMFWRNLSTRLLRLRFCNAMRVFPPPKILPLNSPAGGILKMSYITSSSCCWRAGRNTVKYNDIFISEYVCCVSAPAALLCILCFKRYGSSTHRRCYSPSYCCC